MTKFLQIIQQDDGVFGSQNVQIIAQQLARLGKALREWKQEGDFSVYVIFEYKPDVSMETTLKAIY